MMMKKTHLTTYYFFALFVGRLTTLFSVIGEDGGAALLLLLTCARGSDNGRERLTCRNQLIGEAWHLPPQVKEDTVVDPSLVQYFYHHCSSALILSTLIETILTLSISISFTRTHTHTHTQHSSFRGTVLRS